MRKRSSNGLYNSEAGGDETNKMKGLGYSLYSKLWVLTNFVFQENCFTTKNEILSLAEAEKENFSLAKNYLGRIVMDLWGGNGVRPATKGKRGEPRINGYENLAKRCNDIQAPLQPKLQVHWHQVQNADNSLSFLRYEPWSFNGNRCITEVKVKESCDVEVSIQGFKVALDGLNVKSLFEGLPFSTKVEILTVLLDSCNVCSGFQVHPDILPTAGIKNVLIEKPEGNEKKYFSENCKAISPIGQCCSACSSAKRNPKKREERRESGSGLANTNKQFLALLLLKRYFSKNDWKQKSEMMCKRQKASKIRESRMKERFEKELLKLDMEDHQDLKLIMDNQSNENVPEDMKTLWEQQKRISESHSKNGYRWHPK